MENECILTVSIAAYNVEKYLSEALKPFANEKLNDRLEVLIISDGSTDKTETIGQDYVDRYPRIFKLIKKENGGWGSTVNKGISIARGKYFKQLDGDDYFKEETLTKFIDFLSSCNEDLVISPFATFDDETGKILEIEDFDKAFKECSFPMDIGDFLQYYQRMFMHAACLRTNLLTDNRVTLEEKCFYTDVEFIVKSIACVKTVNLFNEIVYMYRLGRTGQSMSLQGLEKHYKEHQRVALKLSRFCDAYLGDKKIKEAIISRTMGMVVAQYDIYLLIKKSKQHKSELRQFDFQLKSDSSDMYERTNIGKKIILLRMSKFQLYSLFWILKNSGRRNNK